ncbi:glutaredoxin 3 [Fistulifera solaris]|uniref:Glutaredoxin 3 n=1 Tax=Fistulifera solaris TaxID=1519565 RepID=A0A1Z5KSJ8_FISSO|nr:glutaredoxin 3 [Fistulifera solaris]|eukprot:GAX28971.1 glutaredoxin 3 [Fistulifera solaris]
MSELKDFIQKEHDASPVVVWSKSYCPYCTATKNLFQKLNVPHKVHELDQMSNGNDIQAALQQMTGQRTVPNVFIKGKHLGGNDDTQAAHRSGHLQQLLSQ